MALHSEKTGDKSLSDDPSEARPGKRRSAPVLLKSLASLERLRDRVEVAAHELKRLREENESLARRIRELESKPSGESKAGLLSSDQDPELLKRKIAGFIEAIDRYLERERSKS